METGRHLQCGSGPAALATSQVDAFDRHHQIVARVRIPCPVSELVGTAGELLLPFTGDPTNDLTVARTHQIIRICERQGVPLPILADHAHIGAGAWMTTPARRPAGCELTLTRQTVNRALERARKSQQRSPPWSGNAERPTDIQVTKAALLRR
jgi:hypothetical protein